MESGFYKIILLFSVFAVLLLNFSCSDKDKPSDIDYYTFEIVNSYPHDKEAFTQGLVFKDGFLYESTGRYGRSSVRKLDLKTGNILQVQKLSDAFFGEGITIYGDKLIQLTWRQKTGFVYDVNSFEILRTFNYKNEGWGITGDSESLIISDGSSRLRFLNPQTFEEHRSLTVLDDVGPVPGLNELEYFNGRIYANVYPSNLIAQINPDTGRVTAWIDLTGLLTPGEIRGGADILNGIAYDKENNRIFVTGKLWPRLFEIKLIKQN